MSSTNTVAKQRAEEGASEGTLIVANSQSAGRGRQGRSFPRRRTPASTSPSSYGRASRLAMSRSSRATRRVASPPQSTECTDRHAQIKWVNDVFVDGCKVSGILSEASFDAETQNVAYVVVGIA